MSKKFARKFATLMLSFAMVFSCLFVLSACKNKEKQPEAVVTISSISVELVENSAYTLSENVIETFYNGEKLEFDSSDFVVVAHKSDNTTAVLSQKTENNDGYTLTSTIPSDEVTSAGKYALKFAYAGVSDVEIQVIVNKGTIDVSEVELNSLTYNGSEQTLQVSDILNLPENVTAEFVSGNSGTNAQNYDAVIKFTYTGEDAENYNEISDASLVWTMNKANYDLSNLSWVRGENVVYNGLPHSVEVAVDGELPEGVTIRGYLNNEFINAGSYSANIMFNYDIINYNKPSFPSFSWKIEKAPLTITANDASIIFGGSAINNGVIYDGFVNGETKTSLDGTLYYDYSAYYVGAKVGVYNIIPSGYYSMNYAISYVYGKLEVKKATYSYDDIVWIYNGSYTYNHSEQKPIVEGVPELVGYTIVSTKASVESESVNAGKYVATFTVVSFDNYDFTGEIPTLEYEILKANLSISANGKTISYGDAPSNAGVYIEGFKSIDNESVLKGELVYSYNYKQGDNAGNYTISISGVTADNYNITFNAGVLKVNPITLQYSDVTFDYDEEFIYDGTAKQLTVKGVPNYVDYDIKYTKGGEVASPINAGVYVASIVVEESGNFVFMGQVAKQEFVIEKAELVITANPKTITYLEEPTNAGVVYSGFVNGETEAVLGGNLSYSYGGYVSGCDIGSYDIVIVGLTSNNYSISYVSGILTVEAIKINVSTYCWNNVSFTYNGNIQAPTLLNEKLENISDNIGVVYTYLANKVEVDPINVGIYEASASFNTSKNYEVIGTVESLEFEIEKANLTITAKDHIITYLDSAENDGVEFTGFVNNETESVLQGELVYSYTYSQGDDAGVYTISISGYESDNYEITYISGALIVDAIIVELDEFIWNYQSAYTYSGVTQKPTLSTYPNFLNISRYEYTKDSVENDSVDAGTYLATAIFEESDNYIIDGEVVLEYVIEKAELVITASPKTITYLDEPSNAGVICTGFVSDETESVLKGNLVYSYNYKQGDDAGVYTISISGYESDNYEISYVSGVLTVDAIVLNYSDISFDYDDSEEIVYNGTEFKIDVKNVPQYVDYSIEIKLNDESVQKAIDAGTYTAIFKPETSNNYVFNGTQTKQIFTIKKATIDESAFGFIIDGNSNGISKKEKGQDTPDNIAQYKSTLYYNGRNRVVEFVNNTGIDGVEFNYLIEDEYRTSIKNLGSHMIAVDIVVSENVLKNYEALELTQYVIEVEIIDYMAGVIVTYIPENGEESVSTDVIPVYQATITPIQISGLIIDIQVELIEFSYLSNVYTDETFTTYFYDSMTDLNIYDNLIYIATQEDEQSEIFDVRKIKFEMTFNADVIDDLYTMSADNISYSTTETSIKSVNIESDTVKYFNKSNLPEGVVDYCEIGYYKDEEILPEGDEGEIIEEITPYFTSDFISLKSGVNSYYIRFVYVYAGDSYVYERAVNIVYSINNEDNFEVIYNGNYGEERAIENSLRLSGVSVEDILGDDIINANPTASLYEICKDIQVNPLGGGRYIEIVGDDEYSRYIHIENGNAYLVIPVKEKDNNDVITPGQGFITYSELDEEEIDECLLMFICLAFDFNVDFDADVNVFVGIDNKTDAENVEYIETQTGEVLNAIAKNHYTPMIFAKVGDSLADLESGEIIPTIIDVYYGDVSGCVFNESGVYALIVMPTIALFGADSEPKVYIFVVEEGFNDGVEDGEPEEFLGCDLVTFVYNGGEDFLVSSIAPSGEFSGDFVGEEVLGSYELVAELYISPLNAETFIFDGIALGEFFKTDILYFDIIDANNSKSIEMQPFEEGDEISYIALNVTFEVVDNSISMLVICYEDESKEFEMGTLCFIINFIEMA